MEKYVGRELERRRYFEIGNFKKKKRLGTCSGTEVEVTLNNDLFLGKIWRNGWTLHQGV